MYLLWTKLKKHIFLSFRCRFRPIFCNTDTGQNCATLRHQHRHRNPTPYSPDLSPIEHLCDHLDRQVRSRSSPPSNLQQLQQALQEEWSKISQTSIQRLVSSTRRRCIAVKDAQGGHTWYWMLCIEFFVHCLLLFVFVQWFLLPIPKFASKQIIKNFNFWNFAFFILFSIRAITGCVGNILLFNLWWNMSPH